MEEIKNPEVAEAEETPETSSPKKKSKKQDEWLLVVENFANAQWNQHKIGVPFAGKYKEILNTDALIYGGSGSVNPRVKVAKKSECDDREFSITVKSAPLSVQIFACTPETAEEKAEREKKEKSAEKAKAAEKTKTVAKSKAVTKTKAASGRKSKVDAAKEATKKVTTAVKKAVKTKKS